MFAINHLVVNKLKTCDTTDKAKRMDIIIAEGNLACAGLALLILIYFQF